MLSAFRRLTYEYGYVIHLPTTASYPVGTWFRITAQYEPGSRGSNTMVLRIESANPQIWSDEAISEVLEGTKVTLWQGDFGQNATITGGCATFIDLIPGDYTLSWSDAPG